ncbi:hypothetical protein SLA2020_112120 [Shorea laevis]
MGDKIKFWRDKWVGTEPLSVTFPRLFNLAPNKNVTILEMGHYSNDSRSLEHIWRRKPFGRERDEEQRLNQILLGEVALSSQPDQRSWSFDTGNGYTVGKAYLLITSKNGILEPHICKRLWGKLIPSKISCFGWRLLLNGLPTKSGLIKRGIQLEEPETLCCICRRELEDDNHLFIQCSKIQRLWMRCYK